MIKTSNILLVGGGGLGVIAALSLEASSRAKVTVVLRSNYETVSANGYKISSCDHGEIEGWRPSKIVNDIPHSSSNGQVYDYIVITTKNIPGLGRSMADVIAPAISPSITVIVLIQNGLNIERKYIERYPSNVVLSGISFAGSQETRPGWIQHTGHDHLLVGAFQSTEVNMADGEAAAKNFVSLYAASGKASCYYTANTMRHRWRKLVYNATINPLCAITNLDSGSLRQGSPAMRKVIQAAMEEIIAAAAAAGHRLPLETAQELLDDDAVDDNFEPSMLQDVRRVCTIPQRP
ncbi:2-dehydropantoate 2-reductase family [Fusarium sp. NRRL 25303]|nr:2-dehydropantoate 2-reductase family [Fusarium sp. NRRL 25303]